MPILTPGLSPPELELFVPGQVSLDDVVGPLDDHVIEPGAAQHVGRGRRQAERVNRPARTADTRETASAAETGDRRRNIRRR